MLTKIKRRLFTAISKFPIRWYDESEDEYAFSCPDTFYGYILTIPSRSFRGHATKLGKEVTGLSKALGFDELIFLGDYPTACAFPKARL